MKTEDLVKMPQSRHLNFRIKDSIGVPHPYCITPTHVAWASDHNSGRLSGDAIESCEKHYEEESRGNYSQSRKSRGHCGICKGKLPFAEHKQALLIECEVEMADSEGKAIPELQECLLSLKEFAEQNNYAGFAFIKSRNFKEKVGAE